jgi:outer membrane immunogenic protein
VTEIAPHLSYILLTLYGWGTHIMKKTLLLLAMFSAAVGSAQAADMPVKAPVYVAPFTWTGLYLGINAGYGWGDNTGDRYCTNAAGIVGGPGCTFAMPAALKPTGAFVGGQVGYNYQTGLFVWGVEADIQVAHINDSTGALAAPPTLGATITRSVNLDWFGTVRGRLGLAIWDHTLIYGTAGVMYGEEVSNMLVSPVPAVPILNINPGATSTKTGWTAGGGIEYAFTKSLSAKLEGLYYDLGSETISARNTITSITATENLKYTGALVRLGANLKFGP